MNNRTTILMCLILICVGARAQVALTVTTEAKDLKVPAGYAARKGDKVVVVVKNFNSMFYTLEVKVKTIPVSPLPDTASGKTVWDPRTGAASPPTMWPDGFDLQAQAVQLREAIQKAEDAYRQSTDQGKPNPLDPTAGILKVLGTLATKSGFKFAEGRKIDRVWFSELLVHLSSLSTNNANGTPNQDKVALKAKLPMWFPVIEAIALQAIEEKWEARHEITMPDGDAEITITIKRRSTVFAGDSETLLELPAMNGADVTNTFTVRLANSTRQRWSAAVFFMGPKDMSYSVVEGDGKGGSTIQERGATDDFGLSFGTIYHYSLFEGNKTILGRVDAALGVATDAQRLSYLVGIGIRLGNEDAPGHLVVGIIGTQVNRLDGVEVGQTWKAGTPIPQKNVFRSGIGLAFSMRL